MAPDPLIASAFVQIAPEPKSVAAFGRNLKTQLDTQLKKSPIAVPVKVQLLAFKRDLSTQLKNAGLTVPVEPVLAKDFREKVQRAATTALAGLTIPVSVTGGGRGTGTARGGTGTGGGGGAPQGSKTSFEQGLVRVTQAREAAERALGRALSETADSEERATLVSRARTKVQQAIDRADQFAISVGKTKFEGLKLQGAEETELIEKLRQKVAVEKTATKATNDSAAADRRAAAAAEARTDRSVAQAALRGRLGDVGSAGALATTPVTQARARLREAEAIERSARSLAKQEAASRKSLRTEGLLTIETAKRSAALQREIQVLAQSAAAEAVKQREAVKTALAEQRAGQAAADRARRQEQALRGGGATILSRLGARGATLAAGGEFLAGAALVTALAGAVDAAADFEVQLNLIEATAGATREEMEAIASTARELGRDITLPAVGANDAAAAMQELAKAGLNVQDSIAGARGVLQLATAGQIENAQATELVASALNAFGLAGTQAVRVADLLTGASIESQGSISDMGVALQQSAAAARQAGLSLEDTVALLTILARNGLRGSDAGTSLRTSLIRLINPSKKAQEELDRLNVRIRDAQGNIRPEIYNDLANALNSLGAGGRDKALATIFGQDAFRAAAILGREGTTGLNEMRTATQEAGLAAEIAGARTEGFAGTVESLKNSSETLGVSIGTALIPPLDILLQSFGANIMVINKFIDAIGRLKNALPDTDDFELPFELPGDDAVRNFLGSPGDFGRELDKLTAGGRAGFLGGFFDPIEGETEEARQALASLEPVMTALRGNAAALGSELAVAFGAGGDANLASDSAVEFIRDLKDNITDATPNAEALREALDQLERAVVALGRAPTTLEIETLLKTGGIPSQLADIQGRLDQGPPLEFDLTIDQRRAKAASEAAAREAESAFRLQFENAPPLIFDALFNLAVPTAKEKGAEAAAAFNASFGTTIALAELTPGVADDLSALNAELAKRQGLLDRLQATQAESPTKSREAAIGRAAERVKEIRDAIETITKQEATNAKSAADEIAKARNEADQKFLDALGLDKGRLSNAILRSAATTSLQDDIKTHTALRDFLKKSIDEARKTIKDAKTRAEAVQSLTSELIQENQTIEDLIRQAAEGLATIFDLRVGIAQTTGNVSTLRRLFAKRLRELEKALVEAIAQAGKNSQLALELRDKINDTRRAAFDAINESFELDIEFAETSGNESATTRAREAYIAQLQREQRFYKKGSLEWKRIRNEIANQRKAIAEARGEADRMFTELAFQFMTTQQGFFANVMGNLLPSGAVGGTVAGRLAARGGGRGGGGSGRSPAVGNFLDKFNTGAPDPMVAGPGLPFGTSAGDPGGVLSEQSRVATAESRAGFSAAQAATVIALLRQMVTLLGGIDTKGKHPEARRSQRSGGAKMDVM